MVISTVYPHGVSLHRLVAAILATLIRNALALTPGFALPDVYDLTLELLQNV